MSARGGQRIPEANTPEALPWAEPMLQALREGRHEHWFSSTG